MISQETEMKNQTTTPWITEEKRLKWCIQIHLTESFVILQHERNQNNVQSQKKKLDNWRFSWKSSINSMWFNKK